MKKLILTLSTVLLSACSTFNFSPQEHYQTLSWPTRVKQLENIHSWTIQGAMALRTPKKGLTATLHWEQVNDRYQFHLFGPLGLGHVQLTGSPQKIILHTADQKTFQAATPQELLQKQLGWSLPIANLIYWIRGLPAPASTFGCQWDRYHHLTQLKQQGWQINYSHYVIVNDVDLPGQVIMTHSGIKVRLIIHQWDI